MPEQADVQEHPLDVFFSTGQSTEGFFLMVIFCDELMATSQRFLLHVVVLVVIPLEGEREFWDTLFLPGSSTKTSPELCSRAEGLCSDCPELFGLKFQLGVAIPLAQWSPNFCSLCSPLHKNHF